MLSAHRALVAGAATNNVELAAHQSERPAQPRLPTSPCPGTGSSRQAGRQFHPRTTAHRTSRSYTPSPAARWASDTSAPNPAGHAPTAKSNAPSARCSANGPTELRKLLRTHHRITRMARALHTRRPHGSLVHKPPITQAIAHGPSATRLLVDRSSSRAGVTASGVEQQSVPPTRVSFRAAAEAGGSAALTIASSPRQSPPGESEEGQSDRRQDARFPRSAGLSSARATYSSPPRSRTEATPPIPRSTARSRSRDSPLRLKRQCWCRRRRDRFGACGLPTFS